MKKKLPNAVGADKPKIRLGRRQRAIILRELAETLDEKLVEVQRSTGIDNAWDAQYHFETPALNQLKNGRKPQSKHPPKQAPDAVPCIRPETGVSADPE